MNLFEHTLAQWSITLNAEQRAMFDRYADELQRWNELTNLTAITNREDIFVRHFLDSLRCALSWRAVPATLVDIGTGAGFPGLPLKIAFPAIGLTLVESIEKKAAFLRHIAAELGLSGVEVVTARAETLGQSAAYRERFEVVTARAVADIRALAEYCLPLCAIGGQVIAPKGGGIADEAARASSAIARLGGQIAGIEAVELPGVEPRSIVVIDKISATPPAYPRAPGVPTKRPL